MKEDVLNALENRLPVKERQGPGNRMFKYVATTDVIRRMIEVFKGDWSTEIKYQEIINDQAVVRVRVTVSDEVGNWHYHDGFGSSPLNRGDLGSVFKSATSTAIKHACKRFGVALSLDDDETSPVTGSFVRNEPTSYKTPAPTMPDTAETPSTPQPKPSGFDDDAVAKMRASMSAAAPKTEADTPAPPPPTFETPAIVTNDTPPPGPPLPKVPTPMVSSNVTIKQEPETPAPPPPATPHLGESEDPDAPGTVSEIQATAVAGMITTKGFQYDELVKSSFETAGWSALTIPEAQDLSYNQAVVVIQHGNKLFRARMGK